MNHDDKTDPYTFRVREYLDAEARLVSLRPDNPECGLLEERMEDLWYSMTPAERNQVHNGKVNGV